MLLLVQFVDFLYRFRMFVDLTSARFYHPLVNYALRELCVDLFSIGLAAIIVRFVIAVGLASFRIMILYRQAAFLRLTVAFFLIEVNL